MALALVPAPPPPGRAHVQCSACGKTGHARHNRSFHPGIDPVAKHGKTNGYFKLYQRMRTAKATLRSKCLRCDDPVTDRNRNGEPMTMCRTCRKESNEGRVKARNRFRTALEEIAAGHPDPTARARAALRKAVAT